MITGNEVIWGVIIIIFTSCWWSVIALDNKINEVEKDLKEIDLSNHRMLSNRLNNIDNLTEDIIKSLVGDQLELFIKFEGIRDLIVLNNEMDKTKKDCNFEVSNILQKQINKNKVEISKLFSEIREIEDKYKK